MQFSRDIDYRHWDWFHFIYIRKSNTNKINVRGQAQFEISAIDCLSENDSITHKGSYNLQLGPKKIN